MATDLVNYDDAAEFLGLKRATLRSQVHRQTIPYIRLGPRTVRFSLRVLSAWLDANQVDPRPEKTVRVAVSD